MCVIRKAMQFSKAVEVAQIVQDLVMSQKMVMP